MKATQESSPIGFLAFINATKVNMNVMKIVEVNNLAWKMFVTPFELPRRFLVCIQFDEEFKMISQKEINDANSISSITNEINHYHYECFSFAVPSMLLQIPLDKSLTLRLS